MRIEIETIQELNLKNWEKLLIESENSSFYHTCNWISVWKDSYSNFSPFFIVAKDNEKYLAGIPLVKVKKLGLSSFFSLPYETYGGVISLKNTDESLPSNLCKKLVEFTKGLSLCRIRITDFQNSCDFLPNLGFDCFKVFTHLINLTEKKEDWEDFKQKKRGIVQAEKRGVLVQKINSFEQVKSYFELVEKTSFRHGLKKTRHSLWFYQNIFSSLSKTDYLLWNLAYFEDKLLAGQINFIFKDTIYYWDGASDESFWSFRPNDALFFEAIDFALFQGLSFYNLGASPPDASGLIQFKESWGGKRKTYWIYEKKTFWGKILNRIKK